MKEIADVPLVDVAFYKSFCKPKKENSGPSMAGGIPFGTIEERRAAFAKMKRDRIVTG